MQKALVVRYNLQVGNTQHDSEQLKAVAELNQYLADGWSVKYAYPMSGHSYNLGAVSLVVIEK